ncbi:G-protein coupled receptor Mth2-like isoform X2 [Periplaneta americana]|uniref:G-protein coupled receptor Mth2-like isoform X2 n=1 Tax=Periplaneta americana TaxID=6978 RepID=UPI0037E7C7E2
MIHYTHIKMGVYLREKFYKQWLLVLTLAIMSRESSAGPCCPDDNLLLFHERRCANHEERSSFFDFSLNCSGSHFNIIKSEVYRIEPSDDTLVLGSAVVYTIPAGKYCITTLTVQNDSNTEKDVAIVCSPEEYSSLELSSEIKLYCACTLISAVFLLLTFAVYVLVPELRDLQGNCLMCTVLCLCFAYTSVGMFLLQLISSDYCAYQALFTYYWTLSSFFWLNVVSFNVWRKAVFRRFPVSDKHLLIIYNCFAWGVPLIFLIVATVMHHLPSEEEEELESSCWFDGPVNLLVYIAIPVIVLTCLNTVYFVWTGCRLWSGTDQSQPSNEIRSLKYKCLLYLKLFLLMGMTWVARILIAVIPTTNRVYWIVMNVAVMLQGLFIFLILVLFRKRALRGLLKQCSCAGKFCPRSWTVGEDHEVSEAILSEEVELSQTAH